MYKLKFTLLQQEILSFLFVNAGKSFNHRDLAKSLNKTQAGVAKALFHLKKRNFINAEKDKNSGRWAVELNRENPKIMGIKRAENLSEIYWSGLVEFLENLFPGCGIILFGSYSKGEDTFDSDIDIAIVGRKEQTVDLKNFENLLKKEIYLHFYDSLKKTDKNLKINILKGIILAGVLEI
ncbi:MAG: nucleotidyltransferase domain-containing protein [Nanoarchaeota archaeon]|nr:nucleotidyltransferase domain-containing protein [Nanoarchaeota archaeon]